MPPALLLRVSLQILRQEWSGPNQTHVAPNDVQELRQFVDARRAKELAETGQSLLVGEKLAIRPTRVLHRSQLDDLECLFVEAYPRLTKEHRATHGYAHGGGCDANDGSRRHQEARSDGPIHHLLHDETPAGLLHPRSDLKSSRPSMTPRWYGINVRALSLLEFPAVSTPAGRPLSRGAWWFSMTSEPSRPAPWWWARGCLLRKDERPHFREDWTPRVPSGGCGRDVAALPFAEQKKKKKKPMIRPARQELVAAEAGMKLGNSALHGGGAVTTDPRKPWLQSAASIRSMS